MILVSLLALLVAIVFLVGIHEYGHYAVARHYGVRVLRFSIGFGKVLWSYRSARTGTEWAFSAIPLGGYVKMLDARERSREISDEDRPHEFTGKPLYQRTLIVLAGPVVNLLAAAVLFTVIFLLGEPGMRPVLDRVESGSPAAMAGLRYGDEVLEVEGSPVQTWKDFAIRLVGEGAGTATLDLWVRGESGTERAVRLSVGEGFLHSEDPLSYLGLARMSPVSSPRILSVTEDSPAAAVQLQPGDLVVALDGREIHQWSEVRDFLRTHPNERVRMTVERDGQPLTMEPLLAERDGRGVLGITVQIDEELAQALQVTVRHSFWDSMVLGVARTWEYAVTTLRLVGKMIVGDATTKHLSGPVGIAEYAGASAATSLVAFLAFLALLSVSLGILNLLPIPTLDGGHLVYYLVELVSRRPVPARIEAVGQVIGMAALVFLMTLAIGNDLSRIYF